MSEKLHPDVDNQASETAGEKSALEQVHLAERHPIFGCMKGTLTIMPGVDVTEPADPDWRNVYEIDCAPAAH